MTAGAASTAPATPRPLRLTWIQPEDLVGHELRQAREDGRDASGIQRRWAEAGGHAAPERAGASPEVPPAELRAVATTLLDELAALRPPLEAQEPTALAEIRARCPEWPGRQASSPARSTAPPATNPPGRRGARPQEAELVSRLHAAWLGRAAGCVLGKPVEKISLDGIRALASATGNWPLTTWFTEVGLDGATASAYPWNRRSRGNSLAENIDGAPEDDDLNYPLLGLMLLERHGHRFTTRDVATLWLDELPAGRTFTAERVAYRNLLDGVEPPHTASHRNPFREWIGAQIRADIHGWTNPADPAAAAESAWRDATLTHTGNGVYGAMFTAAAVAAAAGGHTDVHGCLRAGLSVVPSGSRLAHAVRFGVEAAREEPTGTLAGFETVVDRLHAAYGHHHWVHVLPNVALLAAALTHADGDFTGSICRAVSGGWDTDSNGATAGSLAGLLAGSPHQLPARWTAPLRNRLATTVGGMDGIGFDTLAGRTAALVATSATGAPGAAVRPEHASPAAERAGDHTVSTQGQPAAPGETSV